jgi:cysteinyl-tRNA synthetase
MPPKIYNTLTQKKEVLEPLVPGEVRMYACGPTVYDRAHIGHARAALTFDVIWRYLEYRGYSVIYVRNYTDVDDKIINRARELGHSCDALAEEQIEAYRQDMRALGLRTPTEEPRATRHIQEMVAIIQSLIQRGVAYSVDGDVYFEVRRFPDYGKLSHRELEELRAGARVEVDPRKRDPLDFALWKASKPGEPAWESPWGPGRPGWHIECSAMSMKYLGETFDIHGGGADLIFPHHENEIAQSECATGKPFARYWIHNGFVNIHAEKMSKSLGNVLAVRDLLSHVSPDALKLFLLGTHYRAPLDFSEEAMIGAGSAEDRLRIALDELQRIRETQTPDENSTRGGTPALLHQIGEAEREFAEAMDDDFNTPRALAAMFGLTKQINVALREAERALDKRLFDALCDAEGALRKLGSVLGGLLEGSKQRVSYDIDMSVRITKKIKESDFLAAQEAVRKTVECGQPLPKDVVDRIVEYRIQRRDEKDWATADAIRSWLAGVGVIVDDTSKGARWRPKTSGT